MTLRDWPPPSTLLVRSQRLAARAYREIDLARRSPDREGVMRHCEQAAVFTEELADLVRKYGDPAIDAPTAATPDR